MVSGALWYRIHLPKVFISKTRILHGKCQHQLCQEMLKLFLFPFCLDTKWQNVAPVGWFNSNKQASLPCQRADWKWQSLFGFNQKRHRAQSDISDPGVCESRVSLGWRWGWSAGCHLGGFLCSLLIYLFSPIGENHEEKPIREGQAAAPGLRCLGFAGFWWMSVTQGYPKGRNALVWLFPGIFSQEQSGAEGTSSPRQTESAEGLERAVLASREPTNLFHPFGVRLRPGL